MGLRDYLRVIRRGWALILLLTLLGFGVGALLSVFTPTTYESYTQLYVSARADGQDAQELAEGAAYSRRVVNSYVDVITSGVVLDPVVEQLDLDMSGAELAGHITASTVADSALINITATGSGAEEAAHIAEAVGRSLQEVVRTQLEPETESGQSPVTLTRTQSALVPEEQVVPNLPANLVFGPLAGLVLGAAIALTRSLLDNRIHDLGGVAALTDKPILGTIAQDPTSSSRPLLDLDRAQNQRAESFRALRTNLQFINVSSPHRVLAVTSSNPREGKTSTALNLALTIAQAGASVAVVEGDLRSPSFARYLGLEKGAGLSEVLAGLAEVDDVLARWGRREFFVLPAGRTPPNPSELLGSARMGEVLAALSERFDHVIIDAPSVLSVTDAAVIGTQAGGTLVVVAVGATTTRDLRRCLQTLDTARVEVFGVVATGVPATDAPGQRYGSTSARA